MKTVILSHNGLRIDAETDKGLVHIDHSNNKLRIYVPRDPQQRQRCYSTQLPKALVSFLEIEDRTATEVFRLLCLLHEDVIENVLDDNGISRISYADTDDPDTDFPTEATQESSFGDTFDVYGTSSDDESRSSETDFTQGSMASPDTATRNASSTVQRPEYEPEYSLSTHQQASSFPRPVPTNFVEPSSDTTSVPTSYSPQYVRLLDHVIMLARQAAFPRNSDSTSTTACASGSSIQGLASRSSIPSESQLAHDIKIGAAGELYV